MPELRIATIGLDSKTMRHCEQVLGVVLAGSRVDHYPYDGVVEGETSIVLVGCPRGVDAGLRFFWEAGRYMFKIALVDDFEPLWVNRLLSMGADRVVPLDELESVLPEILANPALMIPDPSAGDPIRNSDEEQRHFSPNIASVQLSYLLSTQNFLESTFFNVPAMLCVLDLEGRFILFNRMCEEVSGYRADEVKGRLLGDLFLLPEEKERVMAVFKRLSEGELNLNVQNAWLTKDGRIRQIQWTNAAALLDLHGKPKYVLGMGQDVTENQSRLRALQEWENRFERVFHASPIGIMIVRYRDMVVQDANDSLLRILDREREKVVGRPADRCGLFPQQRAGEIIEQVYRSGPVNDREWRIVTAKKKFAHVLVSLELIEWSQELAALVMVRDISERVQAEENIRMLNEELERRILERTRALEAINREKQAEVEYRKAIESSSERLSRIIWETPDIIAMNEPGGRLIYVNKAGRRLFGLGDTQPLGSMTVYETYPPDQLERVRQEVVPTVREQGLWKGEIELMIPDGRRIAVQQTILAHRGSDGHIDFFSTIIRDITDEKMAAERIRRAYEAEKEVGQMQSNFFTTTSHQFRTPLSTILSSAELLEHYAGRWDREKCNTHLDRIKDQVNHLTHLINAMLDYARLEFQVDQKEVADLDLCKVIDRCVQIAETADQQRHPIQVDCYTDFLPVRTAPYLIEQMLECLLSNAMKYSPPGSTIQLRAYPAGDWILVEVEDQGIGIPDEDLPFLFESFFRGSNIGDTQGNGIGMMIVRRAVDLMGGQIQVDSKLNIGTCVTVRIPVRENVE